MWAVGGRDKFLVDDILGIRPLGGSYISVNDNRVAAFGRGSHGLLEPLAYQLLDERTRAQMRSDTSTKFHILNQFIKFKKKKILPSYQIKLPFLKDANERRSNYMKPVSYNANEEFARN